MNNGGGRFPVSQSTYCISVIDELAVWKKRRAAPHSTLRKRSQQGEYDVWGRNLPQCADCCCRMLFSKNHSELARAAVDHQASVAPSKRTPDVTSKSVGTHKEVRPRRGNLNFGSVAWADDDKGEWSNNAISKEEAMEADQPPPSAPAPWARESSMDASSEDVPSLSDLRVSGDSIDSSGGEAAEGPLRIWAPGTASLSRDSASTDAAFLAGRDEHSPTLSRSPGSDTDILSPVGFWREKFETIDARNATRRFSGWGDSGSGEETSPRRKEAGSGESERDDNRTGWAGGGRPPRQDCGNSDASCLVRDQAERSTDIKAGVGVGRKLFSSPERQRPLRAVSESNPSNETLSADSDTMAEDDHEVLSPMAPPGGGPHRPPFWATPVEPAKELNGGRADRKTGESLGGEEKERGGFGWRRGEAGLVVPDPLPPRSTLSIQQVIPQRTPRIGDTPDGGGEAKRPLTVPRPATASPTLPDGGEHKSKTPKSLPGLTQGVKIVRSYSYHGLGSMALYDPAKKG